MLSSKENKKPSQIERFFTTVYEISVFALQYFRFLFSAPFEIRETIYQCYKIGVKALPIISVTGFIIGLVFTKQSRLPLTDLGATALLPSLVGLGIIKALGPLVTSLICAGKIGSAIGAELGSMKVTEQIDAIEMAGVNAFKYLTQTRILACTLMIPLLTFYMSFMALLGAFVDVNLSEATSFVSFFQGALVRLNFFDIAASCTRGILYGFTIGFLSCYYGFSVTGGTEVVGRAANLSVVTSMFLIFIEEVFIVQLLNSVLKNG
ncbi:MAG: MlaE family ABC transporter permease [Bacteroidota bacterium]